MTRQLSSLLASLVAESAAGVVGAEVESARHRAELRNRLAAPVEELAHDPLVDEQLRRLFPPLTRPPVDVLRDVMGDERLESYLADWEPGDTALAPGGVYVHPSFTKRRLREFPAVEETLGVRIADDLEFDGGAAILTDDAVERVRRALAEELAGERDRLRGFVADGGLPVPVVDELDVELPLTVDDALGARVVNALSPADGIHGDTVGRLSARMRFVREEP